MSKRPVIVHFHLFKNAGTSVDRILEANFGDQWAEIEGKNNRKLDPQELISFLRNNPDLKAVSSHTAVVTVPTYEDIEIIPIFFMRHPIARIQSAYRFERKQDAQTPGALKAKEGDFQHYMDWRLQSDAPWQISNFHAIRLKDFHTFTPARHEARVAVRAHEALASLETVGLVDHFDASMTLFSRTIRRYFPDFAVEEAWENKTQTSGSSLQDNLAAFRERIGDDAFQRLEAINRIDFSLYHIIRSRFER